MHLLIDLSGQIRCLYAETIDLNTLGPMTIRRASHVEPDNRSMWWADLLPVHGPRLGPFDKRSDALNAERLWFEANLPDLKSGVRSPVSSV